MGSSSIIVEKLKLDLLDHLNNTIESLISKMNKTTINMVCKIQVEYLQQPLKSYHQSSKEIISSDAFKSAAENYNRASSAANSSKSSNQNSSSSSNSTQVGVEGSGWGVSVKTNVSHSNAKSNSSASMQAAANQMANSFQIAKNAACRIKQSSHKEQSETIVFQDGFLQIIQRVRTIIIIDGHSAEIIEELLKDSVPINEPKTPEELQEMAEDFIRIYDDGTGAGIVLGPRCEVTKDSQLIIEIPKEIPEFTWKRADKKIVNSQKEINFMGNAEYLGNLFKEFETVSIQTYDGCWRKDFFLPNLGGNKATAIFERLSTYALSVNYDGGKLEIPPKTKMMFWNNGGKWLYRVL